MRRNPCELQIELFCRGVALDPSCDLAHDARGLFRTRAGLGSGLEIVLAGTPPLDREVWVNVPVVEHFVKRTCFVLRRRDAYEILDRRTGEVYPVRLPPEPAWYARRTSSGLEMSRVGVLQGTYLAIHVGRSCAFWSRGLQCRFCTAGLNADTSLHKSVDAVVETARAARDESGVTFVHLNAGYQGGAAARRIAPYVAALKRDVGVLVGVQIVPEGLLEEFDRLIDLGSDHFSFCFEYYDAECFARLCPGKYRELGHGAYFRALEHCQARMPKGSCSGEIIAGNEPVESTLAAIDYITGVGAFPTVCIFRPLLGSDLQDAPAPRYGEMVEVMRHMWRSCRDRSIPIGMTPHLEVSLIVQPTDAEYLAKRTLPDRWYTTKLAVMRRLAAPSFRRRTTPRV